MTDRALPDGLANRIAVNVSRLGYHPVAAEEVQRVLRDGWYSVWDERVGRAIDAELTEYGLRGPRE